MKPPLPDCWPPGPAYAAVLHKLMDEVPGGTVLVSEQDATDGMNVLGKTVRAWVRDMGELRSISLDEYHRMHGRIEDTERTFPFVFAFFHVLPGGREVAFGFMVSRRSGSGGRYTVIGTPGEARLECTARWLC